jgi:GT2 family glycosyltransferase/glycosyltransferase involved in cell wall biosynthesis
MSLFKKKSKNKTKPEAEAILELEEKIESPNTINNEHIDYILIVNSELFDVSYYEKQTSQKFDSEEDGITHYLKDGWKKNLNPTLLFDSEFYLDLYKDVANAEMNPFIHYLRNGIAEFRVPSASFDPTSYCETLSLDEKSIAEINPIKHFIQSQERKQKDVKLLIDSGLFDLEYYESTSNESFNKLDDAVFHYINVGWKIGAEPCALFDSTFYLDKYQDISAGNLIPFLHYIGFGAVEGRAPSSTFNPSFFIDQLNDREKTEAIESPLAYFNINQYSAKPCALFSADFYVSQLSERVDKPFSHYLKFGFRRGLRPHPLFDSEYFISSYGHSSDIAPLTIYSKLPSNSIVNIHPLFDSEFYSRRYPEALEAGIDLLSHYILIGSGSHYWPMPLFWPAHYEKQINTQKNTYDSHLTHYVLVGERNFQSPCPLFNIEFYVESYKFTLNDKRGVLAHYYYDGWKHDFMPSEKFSPRFMKSRYNLPDNCNTLSYYLHNCNNEPTLPQKAWHDTVPEYQQLEVVENFFAQQENLTPTVSVIIPVYNFYSYTLRCLYSIAMSNTKTVFEIIIADDLSQDETESILGNIDGIKYIRNPKNLGFLRSCNNAALSANGEYIFLLNNDTAVLEGWLDNLVNTFDGQENIGLVGSQLLYPNGLLQEAGGILWSESAANYGKFDDPRCPNYSYLREVDYVSGAAIMVPTKIWRSLEGFDERYAPAYCEDSDLCLQLRNMGYKVLMQPTSKVVHFEGISSGTDLNTGVKKYQVTNSEKLKEKWSQLLSTNGLPGDFSKECVDRNKGSRILIIDATIPTPDQDAGSVTVWYFLKILKELGYQVTFIPENLHDLSPYTEMVQGLGVECLYRPYVNNIEQYIEENGHKFDTVMLYRVNVGGRFFETVRKFASNAKIIFDTVDLHFLREERQAKMEKDKEKSAEMLANSYQTRERELHLLRNSDISIVLSEYEKSMLSRDWDIQNTFVIPIVLEVPGLKNSYENRKDIAFIGGYQHTPNVDAVFYFVENIWPKVKENIKGVKFYIIGSKPTAEILALPDTDEDIIVTGFIESLDPYLDNLRLTLAPLRYGAGIKGKIGSSLSYGVPCIATKVAAEGMGLTDRKNILMSADENSFVYNLTMAYNDRAIWDGLSEEGLKFVDEQYSINATRNKLLALMNSISTFPFYQKTPFTGKNELMRLASKPHTNNLLCEHNQSTSSQRMLAHEIVSLASQYGSTADTFADAIADLLEKNIYINVDLVPELQKYFTAIDLADVKNILENIALLECNLLDINNIENLDNQLNAMVSNECTRIILVVKGEQIILEDRCDFLLLLDKYCRDKKIPYTVNAHSTTYSEERHITCHLTLK